MATPADLVFSPVAPGSHGIQIVRGQLIDSLAFRQTMYIGELAHVASNEPILTSVLTDHALHAAAALAKVPAFD